ncbi:MAG: hypothetical protein IR160_00770 [Salinibacterium sp.]|nr:hypothetical protein [Salinibacterium sp.]MBF0671100.1 hypothetical protein [Salinibacterium sp.]
MVPRLIKTSVAVVAGVAIGLLGTGSTYAYLNASANSGSAATITSGAASLIVSAPAPLATFYPGVVKSTSFSVSNTGQVPLAVSAASVTSSNAAAALSAGVVAGDCGTSPTAGAALGAELAVVQPGGTASLCLVVAMPLDASAAAASQSTEITIALNGVQQ